MGDFTGHARAIFRAAVAAADPEPLTARATPAFVGRRVHVLAAGKAAPAMARGALSVLSTAEVSGTLLIPAGLPARERYPSELVVKEVRPAGRNEATPQAVTATLAELETVRGLGSDDVLLALFSGGGSATLAAPWPGVPLPDKLAAVRLMQGHGAPIAALNTLRRHLSVVKGGRLAAAAGAGTVLSLLLSDVDGDAPEAIASGPCVADPTTFADALEAADTYEALDGLPDSVREHLLRGARGEVEETPDRLPDTVRHRVVGSPADALRGAAEAARRLRYDVVDLGRGASPAAHAAAARGCARPSCVVSAGEWTVPLPFRAPAGGRAGHSALSLALELDTDPATRGRAIVLCGATDGEDGTSGSAGAVVDAAALRRAEEQGLDAARLLARGDSLRVLTATGALLPGGATGTNVQDLRVVLVP